MTYNIHHGAGIDGVFDLDRIADLIRESGADLVALQEVDVKTERAQGLHTMEYLSEKLDMEWVFGQNLSFQGGGYGNGILSRYPIESWANEHFPPYLEGEQRGLLQTVIRCQGLTIAFWNTHLDHRPADKERQESIAIILEKADSIFFPFILAGDFNDTPDSPAIQALSTKFLDTWLIVGNGKGYTFPADSAYRRIDYLFFKNPPHSHFQLKPIKSTVYKTLASDHLPYITVFKLIEMK
ncbi:MAG: endonuclease/exonuclease/phosphatase family protein [Candidatus Marinimicrobia bacterium]|nr:endonuclease/exonuclease/phosphatase family protein [Candidatus Neomarinimicrobiota bacterium]